MFPQLHLQPSTECTHTDILHSNPILFFDRIRYKTQSQTNLHPSIYRHGRQGQSLPLYVLILKEVKTVFVAAGERFHPVFPLAGTEYVPMFFPEFRPDQCIREEEEEKGSPISDKFNSIHNGAYMETI